MSLHYMHTISCNGRFYVTYILSQFKKKKKEQGNVYSFVKTESVDLEPFYFPPHITLWW